MYVYGLCVSCVYSVCVYSVCVSCVLSVCVYSVYSVCVSVYIRMYCVQNVHGKLLNNSTMSLYLIET